MTYLEKHQVRIRQLAAVQPWSVTAGLALEDAFEIGQELGQAFRHVIFGLAQTLIFLVLIKEPVRVRGGICTR